nr:hypothetical protein HK105_007467 [Polyrhizophydium stewartii]
MQLNKTASQSVGSSLALASDDELAARAKLLQERLNKAASIIKRLNEDNGSLSATVARLETELAAARRPDPITQHASSSSGPDDEAHLRSALDAALADKARLEADLASLTAEPNAHDLAAELEAARAESHRLRAESAEQAAALQAQIDRQAADAAAQIRSLSEEKASVENDVAQLQTELSELRVSLAAQQSAHTNQTAATAQLQTRIDELLQDLEVAQSRISVLEEQLEDARKPAAGAVSNGALASTADLGDVHALRSCLADTIRERDEQTQIWEEELDGLRDDLKAAKAAHADTERQLAAARSLIESLQNPPQSAPAADADGWGNDNWDEEGQSQPSPAAAHAPTQQDVHPMTSDNSQTLSQLAAAESRLAEAIADRDRLAEQAEGLARRVADLEAQHAQRVAELTALVDQRTEERDRAVAEGRQHEALLGQELADVRSTLDAAQRHLAETTQRLETAMAHQGTDDRAAALQATIDANQQQFDETRASLEAQIAELTVRVESTAATAKAREDELSAQLARIKALAADKIKRLLAEQQHLRQLTDSQVLAAAAADGRAGSPAPSLAPSVEGSWSINGDASPGSTSTPLSALTAALTRAQAEAQANAAALAQGRAEAVAQAKAHQAQMLDLEKQLADAKTQLETMDHASAARITELQAAISDLEAKIAGLEEEVAQMSGKMHETVAQHEAHLNSLMSEAKKTESELRREVEMLRVRLQSSASDAEAVAVLDAEIDSLRAQVKALDGELQSSALRVKELEAERDRLVQEHDAALAREAAAHQSQLADAASTAREQIHAASVVASQAAAERDEAVASSRAAVQVLETRLAAAEAHAAQHADRSRELSAHLEQLERERGELQQSLDQARLAVEESVRSAAQSAEAHERSLADAHAQLRAQSEEHALAMERAVAHIRAESQPASLPPWIDALGGILARVAAAQRASSESGQGADGFAAELASSGVPADVVASLVDLRHLVVRLLESIAQKDHMLLELQNQTQSAAPEAGALKIQISELLQQLKQSQESLAQQQDLTRQLADENEQLNRDCELLKERLTGLKNVVAPKLQAEMQESERLRSELAAAEEQRSMLQVQVAELSQAVQSLEMQLASSSGSPLSPGGAGEAARLHAQLAEAHERIEKQDAELERLRQFLVEMGEAQTQETLAMQTTLDEYRRQVEALERERGEWEAAAAQARDARTEAERAAAEAVEEAGLMTQQVETLKAKVEQDQNSLVNLQRVLEQFEASKESEIASAIELIERKLATANKELDRYRDRAEKAEGELANLSDRARTSSSLESELQEKNVLIGKLRHDLVQVQTHLAEAMRRMRSGGADENVDRKLIANLIIGFLSANRGDSKRFEILSLISNVLRFTDEEKYKVGLVRAPGAASAGAQRGDGSGSAGAGESFMDMWIGFLLKESSNEGGPHGDGAPLSPLVQAAITMELPWTLVYGTNHYGAAATYMWLLAALVAVYIVPLKRLLRGSTSTPLLRALNAASLVKLPVWPFLSLPDTLFVAAYAALTAVFAATAVTVYNDVNLPRFGYMALANMGVLTMLPLRNSPFGLLLGVSFERSLHFHAVLGVGAVVLALLHGSLYINEWRYFDFLVDSINSRPMIIKGIAAGCVLALVLVTSFPPWVRDRISFELFYWIHILSYPTLLALVYLHVPYFAFRFLIPGIVLYGLDRVVRVVRALRPAKIVRAKVVGDDLARICIRQPHVSTALFGQPRAGQFYFVQFPGISPLEWHPFSMVSPEATTASGGASRSRVPLALEVQSTPSNSSIGGSEVGSQGKVAIDDAAANADKMLPMAFPMQPLGEQASTARTSSSFDADSDCVELAIRKRGWFTRTVHERVAGNRDLFVLLDGPYGRSFDGVFDRDSVLLVGGGIGVTPLISILGTIIRRNRDGAPDTPIRAELVWVVRSVAHLEWFEAELHEAAANNINVTLFVTDTSSEVQIKAQSFGLTVVLERPRLHEIMKRMQAAHGAPCNVSVAVCGPHKLVEDACHAARAASGPDGMFVVLSESFHL